MSVEATLNNLVVSSNNSPYFTVDPIMFICAGQSFTYNPGVIDLDGDSLVYTSVTPAGVTYIFPFSPLNPFSSIPPAAVNPVTGDFTANATTSGEIAIINILVQEYRNGVLIGSVLRDFQVYIVACSNNLPTASGINGTTNYSITACAGSTVHFTINSADLDAAQTVTMTWNNSIAAPATFTTSTGTRPVGTFHWATTLADVRSQPYTFTVTVRDNNCPSTGAQVYSFNITIHGFTVTSTSGVGTATINVVGGTPPYQYSLNAIPSQPTSIITGVAPGTYIETVRDSRGCRSTCSVVIQ
jgi:hypothetical protein